MGTCERKTMKSSAATKNGTVEDRENPIFEEEDRMTQIIGEFGPWQLSWTSVLCVPIIMHSWQMMCNKFLTYKTDHWCARPELYQDFSIDVWMNISAPELPDGSFDRCNIFDLDYTSEDVQRPENTAKTIKCSSWEYDDSFFQNTAIERYDLVCDRKQIPRYIQTIFFVGNFIGVLLSGILSDKFGRKCTYLGFMTLWIVFGVLGGVINNLWVWAFCRFMCGACSLAYHTINAVYAVEITHGKWRSISGHIFGELIWNFGILSLGALVYGVRNMRTLEVIIGLSCTPWMVMWYFMNESPRWLLANEETKEAKQVLTQACRMNGKSTEPIEEFVNNFVTSGSNVEERHITDLFKTKSIRRNTLLLGYSWMAFSMGYFGLLYNTPSLGWNYFLVFVFPGIIMSVVSSLQPFVENKFGRKLMISGSLLLCGVMLILTLFLPSDSKLIIVCAWVGASACSVAFGVGYVFTKELYPTALRTTALSVCSACARIGSILSPFIGMLDAISDTLPLLVYGAIVFSAGILSMWIWPETNRVRLPLTLDECERNASSRNTWTTCCQRKRQACQNGTQAQLPDSKSR